MFLYHVWYILTRFVQFNESFFKNLFFNSKSENYSFENISFFKKIFISFFSRGNLFNYALSSNFFKNVLKFRKNYLPRINYYHNLNSYYNYSHTTSLQGFNKLVDNLGFDIKIFNLSEINKLNNVYYFVFFLKKNFYKFFSFTFFKELSKNNLIKVNFLIANLIYLNKKLNNFSLFDLNKTCNFFNYLNKSHINIFLKLNFPNKKYYNVFKKYDLYNTKLNLISNNFFKIFSTKYNYILFLPKHISNVKIELNNSWVSALKHHFPIRFNESSTNKFIEVTKLNNYSFLFIRKNRIFNKGRYSRNRQLYRTGVYWCLWLNILAVYGLYFIFYRFVFNFGYLWLPLIVFFGCFLFSRMLKFNLFNYKYVIREINLFFNWFSHLWLNFIDNVHSFLKIFLKKYGNFLNIAYKNNYNSFYLNYFNFISTNLYFYFTNLESFYFTFFWKNLTSHDNSFSKILKIDTIKSKFNNLFYK